VPLRCQEVGPFSGMITMLCHADVQYRIALAIHHFALNCVLLKLPIGLTPLSLVKSTCSRRRKILLYTIGINCAAVSLHCAAYEYIVSTRLSCRRYWVSVFIQINSRLTKFSSTWFVARDLKPSVIFLCISARIMHQYLEARFDSIQATPSHICSRYLILAASNLLSKFDSLFIIIKNI
jgi:hypothetical protein